MIFTREEVERKLRTVDGYIDNFFRALARGEINKAGEFLWAALNALVLALALIEGRRLPAKHGPIREFIRGLSLRLRDDAMWTAFRNAEKLHANFYTPGIFEEEELREMCDDVLLLVKKLYSMVEQELERR